MPNSYSESPLLITMGCPVGIGPEIIIKLFSDPGFDSSNIVVAGDYLLLQQLALERNLNLPIVYWTPSLELEAGTLPVLSLSDVKYDPAKWGKPDKITGRAMAQYIEKAVELAVKGQVSGIVTCPISKYSLQLAGFSFPGHTEMLAHLTETDRFRMMLAGNKLRVVLVTIHKPLSNVASLLNVDSIVDCIDMTLASLKADFGIQKPEIAVAGFNPHNSENGLFGNEEERIIFPAVDKASGLGNVSGPWPPDTVFYDAVKGNYDAVIAMYHDQGLIPFKLLHFDDGVNVTLGLPIVRTSVDHGTAYDIAGKWQASATSLKSAVKMAAEIIENRKQN